MDHFYHNPEWRREQGRMSVSTAEDHASNINSIKVLMQKDE